MSRRTFERLIERGALALIELAPLGRLRRSTATAWRRVNGADGRPSQRGGPREREFVPFTVVKGRRASTVARVRSRRECLVGGRATSTAVKCQELRDYAPNVVDAAISHSSIRHMGKRQGWAVDELAKSIGSAPVVPQSRVRRCWFPDVPRIVSRS